LQRSKHSFILHEEEFTLHKAESLFVKDDFYLLIVPGSILRRLGEFGRVRLLPGEIFDRFSNFICLRILWDYHFCWLRSFFV